MFYFLFIICSQVCEGCCKSIRKVLLYVIAKLSASYDDVKHAHNKYIVHSDILKDFYLFI